LPILIAFLVGILIGYFLRKPKPTKAYFNILPGGVQAAPNTGSQVEWLLNGQYSDNVYIHFLGESPCRPGTGDGHRCTIADGASGQYMYYCTDKAKPNDSSAKILCQDPGIDPNSGGDGGTKLRLPANNVVYAAQAPKPSEPVAAPAAASQIPPTNLTVVCDTDTKTLQVLNPSTTPPNTNTPNVQVGGLIQWNSTLNPTIKIDPNQCDGSLGSSPPNCTVKQAGDISYTIEVPKNRCTNAGPTTFHLNVVTPVKGCPF
jgi:hypothetical protein